MDDHRNVHELPISLNWRKDRTEQQTELTFPTVFGSGVIGRHTRDETRKRRFGKTLRTVWTRHISPRETMNHTNQSTILPAPLQAMDSNEQVAFLKSVLESSTEYSIVAQDLDGTILAWNEGARRNYGYEPAEVVGKASAFILHPAEDVDSGYARSILDLAYQKGKW